MQFLLGQAVGPDVNAAGDGLGDAAAGDAVAGDAVAGDAVAGDAVAGDAVATAAEPVASIDAAIDTVLAIWRDFLEHLPLLTVGVVVLIGTWLASAVLSRVAVPVLRKFRLRASLRQLFARFLYLGVWIAGLLIAAVVVFPGVTPGRVLATLGLGSIAIGLAFKDIFENFFAGILILWRFPFENGDFIACGDIVGSVEGVTVRNTLIRKTSGELVVVPNATIFKSAVDVLTNLDRRRVTVGCGVSYDTDVDQAREVIERAVRSCDTVDRERPVQIFAREFASSSIDFEVTWWTGARPLDVRKSRDEVVSAVKRALDDANIEIPFPYRTLTFKEPLTTVTNGAGRKEAVGASTDD